MNRDLTGARFGRWRVASFDSFRCNNNYYFCVCDCGTRRSVSSSTIKRGRSKSCGCLRSELNRKRTCGITHGMTKTKEYRAWRAMRNRCENTNQRAYHRYGGRGISVCKKWDRFEAFFADMGKAPSARHSIDRINNDGNYEPGNCRWALPKQQSRNTSTVGFATIDGVTKSLPEWCEEFGTKASNIPKRIRSGYSMEDAIKVKRFRTRNDPRRNQIAKFRAFKKEKGIV